MLKLWDVIKLNSFNDILKILTPFYDINHKFANFVGAKSYEIFFPGKVYRE